MKIKVPSYYKSFHCKCGKCRNSCCMGWNVTLSFEEYTRLIGMDVSPDLRERIDKAFYIIKNGGLDRYAMLNHNYLGKCPLQRDDGLCAIQKELGEEYLPLICRLYPRNIVFCALNEGALSNSCEGVIDLLVSIKDGLGVDEIDSPFAKEIKVNDEYKIMQDNCLNVLKDRSLTLEMRLVKLGEMLGLKVEHFKEYEKQDAEIFETMLEIVNHVENYSPSFKEYSIISKQELNILSNGYDFNYISQRYEKAKQSFFKNFPDCQIYFENIMINHLFYTRFPYSDDKNETLLEKYSELCSVFLAYKFVLIAYLEDKTSIDDFVNCTVGLFRCLEHSNASKVILNELKKLGKMSYSNLVKLINNI